MVNSSGKQDLIVNILAPGQRYEVANYGNVTIPTNLDVAEQARSRFGEFYAALFDRTLERNKGAVVTEYSWDASSCDPCPEPPLEPGELMTLGADVLRSGQQAQPGEMPPPGMFNFVLTRLHARYAKGAISEDLVFKAAPPIAGGREVYVTSLLGKLVGKPSLERGSQSASMNNFQGRYAIRHEWTGPIACANPKRGVWGGPPGNQIAAPVPATDLAFVPRGKVQLAQMVRRDVPELGVVALPRGAKVDPVEPATQPSKDKPESKGCAAGGGAGARAALLLCIALAAARRRRRR